MSERRPQPTWCSAVCLGLLCLAGTLLFWWVCGYSLNLLLLGATAAAVTMPAFGVHARHLPGMAIFVFTAGGSVFLVWMSARHGNKTAFLGVLLSTLVLLSLLWLEVGLCRLLVGCRLEPVVAAAVVTTVAMAWLLWPLWTAIAPPLCVRLHPLLAINGVVVDDLGVWTEQPVAYSWIALGQDVSYRLPQSPWACVAFQFGIGTLLVLIPRIIDRLLRLSGIRRGRDDLGGVAVDEPDRG